MSKTLQVKFVNEQYFLDRIKKFEDAYGKTSEQFLAEYEADKNCCSRPMDFTEWAFLYRHFRDKTAEESAEIGPSGEQVGP